MRSPLPAVLRMLFPGAKTSFVFDRQPVVLPPEPDPLNLYIHLPFCRSTCHFCPYVKIPYDASLADAYLGAVLAELDGYRKIWGNIDIDSVYFGGGTPSLTPELVHKTLSWIAGHFRLHHEAGVEIHPLDVSNSLICSFRQSGVSMVSLGVQSFNDRLLRVLGRGYNRSTAIKACEQLLQGGFDTVDIDLIFAIPSQNLPEAVQDMETAFRLGADQVSSYPLIPFSYTPVKTYMQKAKLSWPGWRLERKMLNALVKQAEKSGCLRTSIWSFNRPQTRRYTTVTRDAFIGIGAGASSRIGDYFWLNSFSVPEYIRSMSGNFSPRTLATRLNDGDKMAYWLFWQCYNTTIDHDAFHAMFGRDMPRRLKTLLSFLNSLGMTHRNGSVTRLTDRGAYLFHLIEKGYTHAYLEKLWNYCFRQARPQKVVL